MSLKQLYIGSKRTYLHFGGSGAKLKLSVDQSNCV